MADFYFCRILFPPAHSYSVRKGVRHMRLNESLRLIAGVFVLGAVVLGATVHPYYNYFAAFVAANLIQSSFSGWCPMMALLRRLGVQE